MWPDSSLSRETTRIAAGSTTVTSAAGTSSPRVRPAIRLTTTALLPSGEAATAYGSRPPVRCPRLASGEAERTVTSSETELATTSRPEPCDGIHAIPTGAVPTGAAATSFNVAVSRAATRSPLRQVT
jgi:hypothetical protein